MKHSLATSLGILALTLSTNAYAASAIVTTSLNLRTGPGTQYRTLGSIPNGVGVVVAGCTSGYGWCRVSYAGMDGWASSRYIAVRTSGGYSTDDNFGSSAAAIGIPLIAGIAIGSAINNNNYYDGPGWGRGWGPGWGPRPYAGWRGGPNYYNGCIGRNCQSGWGPPRPHWGDRPGWRDHPGYHHPFAEGPGNRWGSRRR
ncbi:hypothetical protein Brsp05_04563 [Brucella sp. NBRC 12953]|uniref:SH3 domain-containing protein n=1 Tax=Brucella sp. NBRC 12953 TaxID=3075481 RepID=UPI00309E1EBD